MVTVVDFDYSASVIYSLGDPAGAKFDGIDSSGGTDIASGVEAAINELTKNKGDVTAGRSGIVVLTDGESSLTSTLKELQRAKQLGIRVSFGFLSENPPTSAADLLAAILDTGGVYSTITTAGAQQNFVNLVARNGLTGLDNTNSNSVLYPGLAIAGNVSSSTGPKTYTYSAKGGEKLNFTVDAVSGQTLDVTLKDAKAKKDIDTASTDQSGHAELLYTPPSAVDLALEVTTKNATTGLFTVGFNSSIVGGVYGNGCKPRTPTHNK